MKGQTAIEYLMTYGWAILIILIVAGVLAYYGIFAPKEFLMICKNCYNTNGDCFISNCTCNDSTKGIQATLICGYQEPHYTIP